MLSLFLTMLMASGGGRAGVVFDRFGGEMIFGSGTAGKVMAGLLDKVVTLKVTSSDPEDEADSSDKDSDTDTDVESDSDSDSAETPPTRGVVAPAIPAIPPMPPIPPIPPVPPVPPTKFQFHFD